jgi:hypothetical protein
VFEGISGASVITKSVPIVRAPQLISIVLVHRSSSERAAADELPKTEEGMRQFRLRLPADNFARLEVSATCALECTFIRVTDEGVAGERNAVAAGDGVCPLPIGDPVARELRYRVEIAGVRSIEATPVLVQLLP